jgi:hypothetical protein
MKPMERDDRRKQILPTAENLAQKCKDLRYIVEHPNREAYIMSQTGVTVERDPKLVMTAKIDGVEVGYRVVPSSPLEINPYFQRDVFVKFPGYRLDEVGEIDRLKIANTVCDEFLDVQQGNIINNTTRECIALSQQFQVAFPVRVSQSQIQVPA